jgi:hypothetical protein
MGWKPPLGNDWASAVRAAQYRGRLKMPEDSLGQENAVQQLDTEVRYNFGTTEGEEEWLSGS